MTESNLIEYAIGALLIMWNGWLSFKHFEIKEKYNNLCAECQFDFKPKIKPPLMAA